MNIKRMRLVLPARMTSSALMDGRVIAEGAARALREAKGIEGPVTVQVQGEGQPAMPISRRVFREIRRLAKPRTRED
jgi:hypothetical protein